MSGVVKDRDFSNALQGIFVYPDPITEPEMINGATLLFEKKNVCVRKLLLAPFPVSVIFSKLVDEYDYVVMLFDR